MKNEQGFTVIELLMVVVLIGIIVGIAVPSLSQARRATNEASAIGNLRTAGNAQELYHSTTGRYGFLTELHAGNFIDESLIGGRIKAGYRFSDAMIPTATEYNLGAVAISPGSGDRRFSVTEGGVLRFDDVSPSTGFSDPVGRNWTAIGVVTSS